MAYTFLQHPFRYLLPLVAILIGGQQAAAQTDSLPTFAGDTVEVVAEKSVVFAADIAATRTRFKEKDLENHASLAELLGDFPGAIIKSYGGSGGLQSVGMRGASSSQTLLLLDGIPINSPQNGANDFGQVDLAGLSSVDVYSGGNSTLFGSGAIGGVINTSIDISRDPLYRLAVEAGAFDARKATAAVTLPFGVSSHRIQWQQEESDNRYRFQLDDQQRDRQNSDFQRYAANYFATAAFSDNHNLLLHAAFQRQRAGTPGPLVDINAADGQAQTSDQQQLLRLKWQATWHPRLTGTTQIYDRREWNTYRDPQLLINGTELYSRHYNRTSGFLLRQAAVVSSQLVVHHGVEADYTTARSSELTSVEPRTRLALYGLLTWQLPPLLGWNWKVDTGLRLEDYSDFGNVVLPRGGIEFIRGPFTLFGSLGKSYRAPTYNDLYWGQGGNPELQPERAMSAETGVAVKGQWPLRFELHSALFRSEVEDYIRWTPGSGGIWQPQNIETVRSTGVETRLVLELLPELLTLQAHYSNNPVTKSASDIDGDATVGNRLPYLPRARYGAKASLQFAGFTAATIWQRMGYRYSSLANMPDQVLSGFQTLSIDIRYSRRLAGQRITFLGKYDNLLREAYQLVNGYPVPLYNWRLGIELTK